MFCSRWRSSTTGTFGWHSRVTESGTSRLMHSLVKPTKSVFVPILACDLESLTERVLSQKQASEMNFREEFLEKLRSCQICKAVHVEVEPIPQICKSQLSWFCHVNIMFQEKFPRQVFLATPTGKRYRGRLKPDDVTTSATLLGPVFVWSKQTIWDCYWPWGIWRATSDAPATVPSGKLIWKWMKYQLEANTILN